MSHPIDPHFLALVVHDLRNPLNVIGLSIRMIEELAPKDNPDLDDDFRILRENLAQIEGMLQNLSDYCRQVDVSCHDTVSPFDPRRLLSDVVEDCRYRLSARAGGIELGSTAECPREVELDCHQARQAIRHALSNAVSAAGSAPIRVSARGGPQRWITEIATDARAGEAVQSVTLRADNFERLSGTAAERKGLELALVAAISERFGGSARLEVDADRATRIILDWPGRVPPS